MKRNNLEDYKEMFCDLELSANIDDARKQAGKHLASLGYIVNYKVPIPNSTNKYDLVVFDRKTETYFAVVIGRTSVRKLRMRELDAFKGDKVYLLRGQTRTEPKNIYGVNVVVSKVKGSL